MRRTLRTLLLSSAIALASFVAEAKLAIVIVADDLAEHHMARMPKTLDALARQGVTYSRSYASQPLCTPGRTALFTSRYPDSHGVLNQANGPSSGYTGFKRHENATIATALRAANVEANFIGHYIVRWTGTENTSTFRPPGWTRFIASPGGEGTVFDNGRRRTYAGASTDAFLAYAKEVIGTIPASRDALIYIATHAPHTPYTPSVRNSSALPGLPAPRTPDWNVPGIDFPAWLRRSAMTPSLVASDDAKFLGSMREALDVDDLVGELTRWLASIGRLNDAMVLLTSDNGYHFGNHATQAWDPPKQLPYWRDMFVPTYLRAPGARRGVTEGRIVNQVDVVPTVMDFFGKPSPSWAEGRSLFDLERGRPWRTSTPYRFRGYATANGVRTERWTYAETNSGQVVVFDALTDPHELRNHAGRAGVPQAQLRRLMQDWRACRGAACRVVDRAF